ncbi:MAG: crotonase/enoyl-CoA hydratase family protein [Methylocystaceae bacterium]|nr:crotonase/enoyl-CoA hydratase family protein [Methylocystaceae bacterium]
MTNAVTYEQDGDIAIITLNDGKANAFTFDMIAEVDKALDKAEQEAKAVIMTGRAGMFCGGFDLKTMMDGGDGREKILLEGFKLSYKMMNFPYPIVIASTGHSVAYGGVLLLSADYRVSSDGNFKIGLNEIAIGLVMPDYGVDLVRNRIPLSHQIPAMANSVLYNPQNAIPAGFIDEMVPAEETLSRAKEVAAQLTKLDMHAHAEAKRALRRDFLQKHKTVYGG